MPCGQEQNLKCSPQLFDGIDFESNHSMPRFTHARSLCAHIDVADSKLCNSYLDLSTAPPSHAYAKRSNAAVISSWRPSGRNKFYNS